MDHPIFALRRENAQGDCATREMQETLDSVRAMRQEAEENWIVIASYRLRHLSTKELNEFKASHKNSDNEYRRRGIQREFDRRELLRPASFSPIPNNLLIASRKV